MSDGTSSEKGASAVEFALILSLLFIVLFGIIQFGIAFNRYQSINAAAREGARLGSIGNTSVNSIQDRVLESLSILNKCRFYSTPGNCSSSRVYTCPGSLAVEAGCIEVSQTNNSGTTTLLTNGLSVACNGSTTTQLTVTVRYRMRITIPLWASPAVNATGSGVFRCENV